MAKLDAQGNLVCQPLKSLKDVLEWNAGCLGFYDKPSVLNLGIDERLKVKNAGENRPKCLLCHDMLGGYLEDKFLQGCENSDAYRFYHWDLIDTFVYFSHYFITIPPAAWIRAAHKNGVQILGTLITEWEDGSEICKELLKSRDTIDLVAIKLADIASVLGFDGWLVNIENAIEEKSIPDLCYFVQQLTFHCHNRLQDAAKVLWYDSVTHTGTLDWQNELNDKNELFFVACDGIFLNYTITEQTLANSRQFAQRTNRCFDVYVGVDVFGRGTPGGGGFHCDQVMEMISRNGLSYALFGQGWVHEFLGANNFDDNERKFWKLLKDFFPRRSHRVPLKTSFCQGYGRKHYHYGKVVSDASWHNLSLQQLQPSYCDSDEVSLTTADAFHGGGCLKLACSLTAGISLIRIFKISLDKRSEFLTVTATWKAKRNNSSSGLCFLFLAHEDNPRDPSFRKATVLTEERCSDKDESILLELIEKETKLKPSLQCVNAIALNEKDDSGWMNSIWDVDTDWLCNDHNQSVSVYTMFMPRGTSNTNTVTNHSSQNTIPHKSEEDVSILLGNLQIEWKNVAESLTKQPKVNDLTCLEVNVCEPIPKQELLAARGDIEYLKKVGDNKLTLRAHCDSAPKVLSTDSNLLSGEDDVSTPISSNQVCFYKNCQTKAANVLEGAEKQSFPLHLLDWTTSDDEEVDYYMVYTVHRDGSKQFVGCSCTNSFATRLDKLKNSSNIIGYFIKPMLYTGALPGQEFSFSIL